MNFDGDPGQRARLKLSLRDASVVTLACCTDSDDCVASDGNQYVVHGLGTIARDRGQYDLAVARFNDALRLIEKHTPGSPNRAFAYANVGRTNMLRQRSDLAIPALQDAIAVLESRLPEHWLLGEVRWRLGQCLLETGDYEEAEQLILSGIAILEERRGSDHKLTSEARAAAALLYQSWARPDRP